MHIVRVIPVQPVIIRQPSPRVPAQSKLRDFDDPEQVSKIKFDPAPESKKDFEIPGESKKIFEPAGEIEFDLDADQGRWRTDDQVKELVVYRHTWGEWPEDVEDKINHPTGLESYYEVRYFKGGTNKKGVAYAELYSKHRAKRDLWVDEHAAEQAAGHAHVDASEAQSNVVSFRRTGTAD